MFSHTNVSSKLKNGTPKLHRHTLAGVPEHSTQMMSESPKQVSPLHYLAVNGNKALLQKHVSSRKWNINEVDHIGRTPLIYSILGDQIECVLYLLKEGAKIDDTDIDERTALHWAAYQGNHKLVKLLLSKGANRIKRDKEGKTPLHFSTIHDNIKVMQFLIKSMKEVEIDTEDCKKMTALCWSVFYDRFEYVKLLLRYGASPTHFDMDKRTVLHWTSENKDPSILNLLLERDFTVLNWRDSEGRSALHMCVGQSNFPLVESLLNQTNIEKNIQDALLRTPLHWAAVLGNTKIVSLLLDRNAEYKIGDKNGVRPLQYAAQNNFYETVQFMIEKKGVKDIPDNDKGTALMWAAVKGCEKVLETLLKNKSSSVNAVDIHQQTALHMATQANELSCVNLLIKYGADVSLPDGKQHIPLFYACASGNTEVVHELLEHSPNDILEFCDLEGRCPLHYAAMVDRADVIKILMQSDHHRTDPNIKDNAGCPPLHFASYGGFVHSMSVLLENGANVNSQNKEGQTALHYACRSGSLDAVKLLVSRYNARVNMLERSSELTPIDYAFLEDHQDVAFYLTENNAYTGSFLKELYATKIQATWKRYKEQKKLKNQYNLRKKFNEEDIIQTKVEGKRYEQEVRSRQNSSNSSASSHTRPRHDFDLHSATSREHESALSNRYYTNSTTDLANLKQLNRENRVRSVSNISAISMSPKSSVFLPTSESQQLLKPVHQKTSGPKFSHSDDNPLPLRRSNPGSIISLNTYNGESKYPSQVIVNESLKNTDYWSIKQQTKQRSADTVNIVKEVKHKIPYSPPTSVEEKSDSISGNLGASFNSMSSESKYSNPSSLFIDKNKSTSEVLSVQPNKKILNNNLFNQSYSRHVTSDITASPTSNLSDVHPSQPAEKVITANRMPKFSSVNNSNYRDVTESYSPIMHKHSSVESNFSPKSTPHPASSSAMSYISSTNSLPVLLTRNNADINNPWNKFKRDQQRINVIRTKMKAAVVIQRCYRRYAEKCHLIEEERRNRMNVPPIVIQESSDNETAAEVPEISSDDDESQELAALVIQVTWREYLKRRLLANVNKDENRFMSQGWREGNDTDSEGKSNETQSEHSDTYRNNSETQSNNETLSQYSSDDVSKANNGVAKSSVKKQHNFSSAKKKLASLKQPAESPYATSLTSQHLTREHVGAIRNGKSKLILKGKAVE